MKVHDTNRTYMSTSHADIRKMPRKVVHAVACICTYIYGCDNLQSVMVHNNLFHGNLSG